MVKRKNHKGKHVSWVTLGSKPHYVGDRVIIKRLDVVGLKRRLGSIVSIDGGNVMVRPYRSRRLIELYPTELDPLPYPIVSASDLRSLLANMICAGDKVRIRRRFTTEEKSKVRFRAITTGAYGQMIAIEDEYGIRQALKYSAFALERISA